jgi:uncharacterized membrane protein
MPSHKAASSEAMDLQELAGKLPRHIATTIQAIAELHSNHHKDATRLQRIFDRFTARVGRPTFILGLIGLVCFWILFNEGLLVSGHTPLDMPPFYWMQGAVSLSSLLIAVTILTTQRREDQLATRREQLTLELAILGDQKAAKIIELLEQLRRDHPGIANRVDNEARDMSMPANPDVMLRALPNEGEGEDGNQ